MNFGWDSIFQPKGFDKTYGEMTVEEKNKVSHRGKAMEKLVEFLEKGDFEEKSNGNDELLRKFEKEELMNFEKGLGKYSSEGDYEL
jgi:uncharacterized protein YifE (UPF0438 family)